ncbi:MAG: hypothetical protein V2A71_01235 [Candidatus Eisenbacteria bacterium]
MRERIPLAVTLFVVGLGLLFMIRGMITPEMYRVTDRSRPVNYVFVPDYDQFTRSAHHVEGSFWSTADSDLRVFVHYRLLGGEFVGAELQRIAGSDKFSFPLPSLEMGRRFFYFLRVEDSLGNVVDIKPGRGFMDRLFRGSKDKLFYVTYEGRPSRTILILHIAFVLGALILMIHGFHFSLQHVFTGQGLAAAYWTLFSAWLLFAVSVLPLGIVVARGAFGVGWSGFPLGTDITDNKSLGIVIYWLVVLARGWRPDRGEYACRTGKMAGTTFVGLSLLGIVLTVIASAIPHSVFIQ